MTRPERLLEYANWEDKGCELHPHCLACPEKRCAYDESTLHKASAVIRIRRDLAIFRMSGEGKTAGAIAAVIGVSGRTVQRVLRKNHHEEGPESPELS